jgi:iron complex transport system substrate-binding protein
MEWLRFFSCFYDKLELADSICNSVSTQYVNLRDSVSNNKRTCPNVMLNIPWQGIWWVPGADSFTAKIIKDAGGNYLFKDYPGKESQAIDMELVYDRARNAQIWLNTGMAKSKTEVFSSDNRLEAFGSLDTLKIYNNNKRISISGNDFYESAVVHPEIILSDLIKIFSFDEAETEDLYYYQKLK